jgi:hypothetical protein
MFSRKIRSSLCLLVLAWISVGSSTAAAPTKRQFTIVDDIGLRVFPREEPVQFSPDGRYFAAWTERGRLDLNKVEDGLRFYRTQDAMKFLAEGYKSPPPAPVWIAKVLNDIGSDSSSWRWLDDSSAVAFVEYLGNAKQRIVLASLRSRTIRPLTSIEDEIDAFDVRDERHFVYIATDPIERRRCWQKVELASQRGAIIGTGHSITELMNPDRSHIERSMSLTKYLWAVIGGKRFKVRDGNSPFLTGWKLGVALSPDGLSVVTTRAVTEVPPSWVTLYPPPYASSPYRIRADAPGRSVLEYVRVDLQKGLVQSLTGAPYSWAAGWVNSGEPSWSSDGRAILLPGTFLRSKTDAPSRPCVAVVQLPSDVSTCLEPLSAPTETGADDNSSLVVAVRFADGNKNRVIIKVKSRRDGSIKTTECFCR